MSTDLKRLQDKARQARQKQAEDSLPKRPRKRIGKVRIAIWLAELLILIYALDRFVIKPMRPAPTPKAPGEHRLKTTPVTPLGADAITLHGLSEVATAQLPPVADLADGSAASQAAQLAVSQELKLPVQVKNSIGMEFRLIPNGTFLIGSPGTENGRWEGEKQHVKTISAPFYMGRTEVTQDQWKAVLGTDPASFKGGTRPVEEITWFDCQRFVIRLCEMEGLPKWTYRLPAEAEWEFACRAGTQTAYYFGDDPKRLKRFEHYIGNTTDRTRPVAQMRANAFGLYDMHGNVWEWCLDTFRDYPGTTPPDPADGKQKAIRGGNWYVDAPACRAANRARLTPASLGNMLGLRVIRVIHEGSEPPPQPQAEEDPTE